VETHVKRKKQFKLFKLAPGQFFFLPVLNFLFSLFYIFLDLLLSLKMPTLEKKSLQNILKISVENSINKYIFISKYY